MERDPLQTQTLKRKLPQTITINSQPKRFMTAKIENDIPIEDMVVEYADEQTLEEMTPPQKLQNTIKTAAVPMKILNKQASIKSIEPILRPPIVKTNEDGHIEVISEIIETDESDLDPMRYATPVETNVFPCNYCERSFPLRQLLDIHVANHVRDRKFLCDVCKKGFFSKYDLGKHELIHTGEKPFKCVVCGKAFSRSTLLRRHEKVHSDQPKFLCAFCERPFLSKEEWEKHTQNHQKRRPFTCDICNKSFAFKQGLERHEVVHSTDQPFKCEHCHQGFSTQGKLARHLTAHAGDRPYPCRICDKSYLLSHHLTRHMRSHKENNQIAHKCTECELYFAKRDELVAHSTIHATENLVCPLCQTVFADVDDVAEHIKEHTEGEQFACEFCDLIFLTESQLHDHSDTQHLEEIELYEMSNTIDENRDENIDCSQIKPDSNEIIEYTEHVEIITPNDVSNADEMVKNKMISRSYGKTKAKPNQNKKKNETMPESNVAGKMMDNVVEIETQSKLTNYGKPSTITIQSPNTRASTMANAKNSSMNKTPENNATISSTRSSKLLPKKSNVLAEKTTSATVTAIVKRPPTMQASLTKFLTIKPKSNEQSDSTTSTSKKLIPLPTLKAANKNESTNTESTPKVTNKLVKVKQIRMTKAQIDALTKEGKIEMRGGQVIFKKEISPKKK